MSSKKRTHLFMALTSLCLVFLLGCAKENDPRDNVIRVRFKTSAECFSGLGAKIQAYREGSLSDAEISATWECVDQALSDYQRLTTGDLADGSYSSDSVAQFLTRYFLQDRPLNPQLMRSILELKRVLVGGSAERLTRPELRELQQFVRLLKNVTLELNPYAAVLFGAQPEGKGDLLPAALRRFATCLEQIGAFVVRADQRLTFARLNSIATDISLWLSQNQSVAPQSLLALIPQLKSVFVGGSLEQIEGQEWALAIEQLQRAYSLYLRVRVGASTEFGTYLQQRLLLYAAQDLSRLLEAGLRQRPGQKLERQEVIALFERLKETNWLPERLNVEGMTQIWDFFTTRLLRDGRASDQLTVGDLRRLQALPLLWINLLSRAQEEGRVEKMQMQQSGWRRFVKDRDLTAAYNWDARGRLDYSLKQKAWRPDSTTQLVWAFVLTDWIKDAYNVASESLSSEDLKRIAGEVFPVLEAIGLNLSSDPNRFANKILREADLFTLASNGNAKLETAEVTRYLLQLASSWSAARVWSAEAQRLCADLSRNCLRQAAWMSPVVLAPVGAPRGAVAFAQYLDAAEETALGALVQGSYTTGDLLQIWMLFQYIEVFLQHFDADADARIQLSEGLTAYQVFAFTLQDLLKNTGLPPDDVLPFFTFLLKYGDTPFTMWGGQVAFNHWRWHRSSWAFSADRSTLVNLLRQLSKL